MPKRTDLADGAINNSDRLNVELVQPTDTPPSVIINWPSKATVCTPATYYQVAAAAMRLLAAASTAIAGLKARRLL
jgi:hypothetical protein